MQLLSFLNVVYMAAALGLGALVGVAEANGLIHASRSWKGNTLLVGEASLCVLYFIAATLIYIVYVRALELAGIKSTFIPILIWFISTIVTAALLSGDLWGWPIGNKIALLVAISAIGWLVAHTE